MYHLTCPISNREFSRETLVAIRKLAYAVLTKRGVQKIWIRDGRVKVGSMWKVGNSVYWRTKGVRTARLVYIDGTRRRKNL